MIEITIMGIAFLSGVIAGGVFFAGLWWTVRKGLSARNPAFLFLASFLVRTAVVVMVFFFFRSHWEQLGGAILGFLVARGIVTRRLSCAEEQREISAQGGTDAH